jgi:hypothetical protein
LEFTANIWPEAKQPLRIVFPLTWKAREMGVDAKVFWMLEGMYGISFQVIHFADGELKHVVVSPKALITIFTHDHASNESK